MDLLFSHPGSVPRKIAAKWLSLERCICTIKPVTRENNVGSFFFEGMLDHFLYYQNLLCPRYYFNSSVLPFLETVLSGIKLYVFVMNWRLLKWIQDLHTAHRGKFSNLVWHRLQIFGSIIKSHIFSFRGSKTKLDKCTNRTALKIHKINLARIPIKGGPKSE